MTDIRVMFVDTFVVRGAGESLQILALRRAPNAKRAGTWEVVHGTIEPGETPVQASRRELAEETGLAPAAFYNLSRTEAFYQHDRDVLAVIPVFVAFVAADATPRLSEEHDAHEWLSPAAARGRLAWPRERRALDDVLSMVGGGSAGLLDGVLRVS